MINTLSSITQMPTKQPLSKIDWNLKYSFPKKLKTSAGAKILKAEPSQTMGFPKSSIMNKIDVFNKHLEKKILKSQMKSKLPDEDEYEDLF